ncbi:MAG TPA: hypothetical protein PLD01_01165 [Mycobacterium sp.]|nr:hypothetical protein [Mycobacterium sp.]HQE13671.1 hypothetical protein [Mycobacterium sp.]
MVRPERRTRGDLIAAAAIAVVIALFVTLIWWHSSARATQFHPATAPAPNVKPAQGVPGTLKQRWTAPSPKTLQPVVVNGTVVTGAGREMAGRNPETGDQRWSYARDTDLCAVSYIYDLAVAVYPDIRGCGQVSTVTAGSGRRGPTRTSYADKQVVVSSDGSAVLSYGATRMELWRSDLVRIFSYGEIDARVKPVNTAVGKGCALMSAAASDAAGAVLEACPGEKDLRLSLITPAKEEDEPAVKHIELPGLTVDSDARVLAVAGTTTAVYLPIPRPEVAIYDDTGAKLSGTPLRVAPTVEGRAPALTRAGDFLTWWTGSAVVVFDNRLGYRYTIDTPALGPAAVMSGSLLIPVADGLAVHDPLDGSRQRVIPLTHPEGSGAVLPAVLGSMVFEQRGDTVAAFGPG